MGSLLVRATFGERVVGILVWQRGKRSSENGFQTTFGLGGKGSSLEDRVRAYRTHPTHGFQILRDLLVGMYLKARTRLDTGYGGLLRYARKMLTQLCVTASLFLA